MEMIGEKFTMHNIGESRDYDYIGTDMRNYCFIDCETKEALTLPMCDCLGSSLLGCGSRFLMKRNTVTTYTCIKLSSG